MRDGSTKNIVQGFVNLDRIYMNLSDQEVLFYTV